MTDETPAPRRRWVAIVGLTLALTLGVILLEAAAFLTPPTIGLGVSVTALSVLALWLGSSRGRRQRAALRLDGPGLRPGEYLAGAALVALVVLSSALILGDRLKDTANVPEMLRHILEDASLMNRLRLVGVIVLLGPIGEEIALRGFLQGQLERRWNVLAAVLTAGIVFAVMHGLDARLFYFIILGVMFGAAVVAFRSLWASIALHMTVNGMVVVPLLLGPALRAGVPASEVKTSPWLGVVGLLVAVPLFNAWLRRGAARRRPVVAPPIAIVEPEPELE